MKDLLLLRRNAISDSFLVFRLCSILMTVVIALREKLPSLHLQEERFQYSDTMRKINKIKRFCQNGHSFLILAVVAVMSLIFVF